MVRSTSHDFDPRRVLTGLPGLAFAFHEEPPGGGGGGGATPPADPPADPPEGGGGGGERMIPQSRVNEITEERLARERRQSRERLQRLGYNSLDELEAAHAERVRQEEEARRQEQEATAQRLRSQGNLEEAVAHEQRLAAEREETLRRELEQERTARVELETNTKRARERGALIEAANAAGAVNVDQVATLLSGRVSSGDDGRVYVLDEQGQRMTDGAGADLEVSTFVRSWVAMNPHFQPAAGGTGAQSRGGGQPPPEGIDESKLSDVAYVRKHSAELKRRARNNQ
jgi:hypothetical protein